MLHLPTTAARPTEVGATGHGADRAMDALQYGLAILAIVGAMLLGSIR